ncbi:MAG: ferritin-like domain-containing protein, partial [Burkholderiales bacterium]|nr:ferritin-like domain-containing protein [Burkholderiales bacterium]
MVVTPISLRQAALLPLLESHAVRKAQLALAIDTRLPVSAQEAIPNPGGIPGRPDRPILVAHTEMRHLSLATLEGRAALVHSIAHIELNAIDLALDVVWRFAGMPDAFYLDWVQIAKEEAKHFLLLQKHLQSLGFDYGDFPAHHALWQMAERTQSDLLARIGLVPRTLEARGLDASPGVKNKLVSAGDMVAGQILDIILEEEIG